jgi:hypothetical protein
MIKHELKLEFAKKIFDLKKERLELFDSKRKEENRELREEYLVKFFDEEIDRNRYQHDAIKDMLERLGLNFKEVRDISWDLYNEYEDETNNKQ